MFFWLFGMYRVPKWQSIAIFANGTNYMPLAQKRIDLLPEIVLKQPNYCTQYDDR